MLSKKQVLPIKLGHLSITESVKIHTIGRVMRYGLRRYFPAAIQSPDGRKRSFSFHVSNAVDEHGETLPFELKPTSSYTQVLFGDDQDKLLAGLHQFQYTLVFNY